VVPRRRALGGLLVGTTALTAVLLADVLATVLFTVTVAYVLIPLRRALTDRGLSHWWASAVTTAAAFVGTLLVLSPLLVVLLLRLDALLGLIVLVPEEVSLDLFGYTYVLTLEQVLTIATATLRSLARSAASAIPVLLIKLSLFIILLFSLIAGAKSARRAVMAVVPPAYRDVADALDRRTRETLFAIYVLQAVTALGTFLVAIPVFALLGYRFPVTLATVAGVLQFIPIVGPSVLLAGLAVFHVLLGDPVRAAVVFVVGGFFVAWLPDILIRPRLAVETAHLPGGLYFVGFVGGLLTLGPVGIVAGPLAVALLAEVVDLLAMELDDTARG
jgi:predicted PurR-regulated permease PerM